MNIHMKLITEQLENVELSSTLGLILERIGKEFNFSSTDCKFIFRHFKSTNQNVAIDFGLQINEYTDPKFCRVLCRILNEKDMSERSLNVSSKVAQVTGDSWHTFQVKLARARSRLPNEISTFFEKHTNT